MFGLCYFNIRTVNSLEIPVKELFCYVTLNQFVYEILMAAMCKAVQLHILGMFIHFFLHFIIYYIKSLL
jgi:hypothetical protein